MTGKQNGKLLKSKLRSNRSSAESPQKDDLMNNSPDLSVLRKPIHTSVTGFLQARDVFDTGTEEIKQLLSTECDVIYECRVCRNLFRSLANFISHKRIYCRQKFNTSLHAHFINTKYLKDDMVTILQNEQDYQNFLNNKSCTPNILQADKESRQRNFTKDLTTVIERLTSKQDNDNPRITKNAALRLQPISQTTEAVYQSIFDSTLSQESIKKQVNEIHSLESSQDVTLGPDGKIIDDTPNANDKEVIHISDDEEDDRSNGEPTHNSNIICKICRQKFSSQKTLRFHIKYKHAENRLVYPCPDCSETFANAWGVYRHLFKVHRKSAAYIRKLRESIHNKAFRLQRKTKIEAHVNADEEMEISEQHRLDLENQEWMDNLEGDCEVPRCGGCGRKFERRAALSAHRQTCQLRIAAQNKITTNMQKRQAAKTTKEMPANQSKGDSEKSDVSAAKISRLETKPIEIQIRRDYHKNSIGSPKRTGTPVSETNGSVCAEGDGKKKGEEGDSSVINSFPCNIIDRDYSKETVQDKDDASIVSKSASNRNVDLGLQDSDANNTDLDEDDELNFEDIRRICQVADTAQPGANKDKTQDKSPHTAMHVDSEAVLDEDCVMVTSQDSSSIKMEIEASFTCNKCSEELISLDKLNEHIKNKHEVTLYQCKFCNYKAAQMSDCISHVRNKHKMLGDDLRIGKFVKSVSVPIPGCQQLNSSEDEEEVSLTSTACQTVGDDDFATVEQIYKKGDNLPAASTDSSPIKEEILSNSSSANCSDMEGEMSAAKRKRGRPRKYEEQLPARGNKVTSVKIVKKVTNLESPVVSANKVLSVSAEEIITSCSSNKDKNKQVNKPAPKSDPKTYMDSKSDKKVSDTQDTASSMSSTVKRPMRNRVKPLNKDFEYDLSNLLKLEAEAYKESHLPTVIYKQPLKRKPLLQNEITTSDPSTQVGEVKERHKSEAEKTCAGALHAVSMRAAEKMKAHMKQMPAIVQKELPAFIAQRRSRVTPVTSPKVLSLPSTPKKDVPVPLKTKTEKSPVQQQITPSMIYEKLSLDNSKVDTTSLNKTPPAKLSRSASNIDIKNEILTNMSKILSKTSKRMSIDMSCKIGVVGIDKNRDQSIRFISVKKEKDLLSPTRLTKKSAISSEKTTLSEAEENASPQNPESGNPENDQTKPDQKNLEDETSEFVASEKLNSVNILRKKKSILHVKCDKIFMEPSAKQKSLILTLKDKFFKQGLSKNDAVDQVGVSENVQSNHSPVSADIDKKKSIETSICDSATSNETAKLVNSIVGESGSGTIDEGFEETLGEKLPGEKSVESSS